MEKNYVKLKLRNPIHKKYFSDTTCVKLLASVWKASQQRIKMGSVNTQRQS